MLLFFFSNKCKQNCHSQLTINRLWEFPFYRITVLQSPKTFAFKTCTFTHTIKQFFCRYIYSTSSLYFTTRLVRLVSCFRVTLHSAIASFVGSRNVTSRFRNLGFASRGSAHELHNHETPLFPQYTQISPIWKQFYTHRSLVLLVV